EITHFSGSRLITGDDRSWRIWDVATGKEIGTVPRQSEASDQFSPDGEFVVRLNRRAENKAELWRTAPPASPVAALEDAEQFIEIRFSPDSRLLAAAIGHGIKIWEVKSGRVVQTLGGAAPPPGQLVDSSDQPLIA